VTLKHLIRLAGWLQRCWQQAHRRPVPDLEYEWTQLRNRWEAVRRAHRQVAMAVAHGWLLCLPECKKQLAECLRHLADASCALSSAYSQDDLPVLSLRHWLEEMTQLHEEFDGVTISREQGKIRVATPPITLREVSLGAFAIDLRSKGGTLSIASFEIEALDPSAANSDSDIFHPHVRDGELCAGDAKVPIRKALEEGRLVDAFLMIQSTLQTYNPRSAYVTLDKWHGEICSDCSETVDPQDSYVCERCHCTLCSQCRSECSSCSTAYCPSCIHTCADCKESYCRGCLEESESRQALYCRHCRASCNKCGNLVGQEELDAEHQYCPACTEDALESDLESEPSAVSPSEVSQEVVVHE
jgi:hypothetical protein